MAVLGVGVGLSSPYYTLLLSPHALGRHITSITSCCLALLLQTSLVSLRVSSLPVICLILMPCFLPFSAAFISRSFCLPVLHSQRLPPLSGDILATNFALKLRCIPYREESFKALGAVLLLTQFSRCFFLSLCELKCCLRVADRLERAVSLSGRASRCLTKQEQVIFPVALVSCVTENIYNLFITAATDSLFEEAV